MRCPRVGILSFLIISLVHDSYAFTLGGLGRESNDEPDPALLTSRKSNDGEQVNRATVAGGNGVVSQYEQLLTFIERNIVADAGEEQSDDAPIPNPLTAASSSERSDGGLLVNSLPGETADDDERQKRNPDSSRVGGAANIDGLNPATVDEEVYVDDDEEVEEGEGAEDDDFSTGVYREKINWDDYRNEDGSSVLELIALNARYKTRMQNKQDSLGEDEARPEDEEDEPAEAEYLYRRSDNDYVEHGDDHRYTWADERLLNPDDLPSGPEEEPAAVPP